jgi:Zn-dependent protease/CBS domain-containing protein
MLKNKVTLFRIAGFKVEADASWLIIAVLVAWSLASGLFPSYFDGLQTYAYWIMGVIGAIGLFAGIVLHELSHSLVARRLGIPIQGITLWIFGGVAHMEEVPPNPQAELSMAIAGPLASITLGAAFWGLHVLGSQTGFPVTIQALTWYLWRINIILGVFNLVPAFPLDGGRILRAGLWKWKNNIVSATRIASIIGSGFAFVLMFLGFLFMFRGGIVAGIWWIVIGIFLRFASRSSYLRILMTHALSGEPVRRFMKTNPVTVNENITVGELVEDFIYAHHYKMFPVVSSGHLSGCVSTREVKEVPREYWHTTRVSDIAGKCNESNTITPDEDASRALSLMQRSGNSRLMVVESGELSGVIVLKDLMRYLALKLDLERGTIESQSRE